MNEKPSPSLIKEKRLAHHLSQTEASQLVYRSLRNWQQFESGERTMDRAIWELFTIKCDRISGV